MREWDERMVLLMVQKSHAQPPGMVLKPVVKTWDKLPPSTGEPDF